MCVCVYINIYIYIYIYICIYIPFLEQGMHSKVLSFLPSLSTVIAISLDLLISPINLISSSIS